MKKLMVLGASQCQVPIIQQAQEMGHGVIVVSVGGDYPGFRLADKSYAVDVRDHEEIIKIARSEKISGILTDQTDISVPTVARVAKALGLPGIEVGCALSFTNKYKMRQDCDRIGIPVPGYNQVSSAREALAAAEKFQFPLILKPVDSQGSRGVIRVNTVDELESAFGDVIIHSSVKQVICEEFFEGKEIVVEGFMANGTFTNLVIGDREYFDIPNIFIPRQTLFPSQLDPKLQQEILELNARLITGLAPEFGITHSEYLFNEESGDIRLVETAIRGGGVFISSDLIPLASGIDANRLLIKHALGEETALPDPVSSSRRAAAYLCFYLPEGTITSIQGREETAALAGVRRAFLEDLRVGMSTGRMTDKTMRLGPIIVAAENYTGLQEVISTVQSTLKVEVSTMEGMKNIIW